MVLFAPAVLGLAMTGPIFAASRASANYETTFETTDAAGGFSSSAAYTEDASIGEIGGIANVAGPAEVMLSGYSGNLRSWVAGRYIFYNQSVWDGNNAAANASDDLAIAADKTALLPGSTAAFANYTSYSRGINGIIVDVTELWGTPSGSDFIFKAGNTTTPASWPAATDPNSISIRAGNGIGGSDRITIIWPNNTIQKTWLETHLMADSNTGLGADDLFYFGNAIGDTGNSTANSSVDAFDEILTRANPRSPVNPAAIDNAFDFNRDKKVDASDQIISRSNRTSVLTALKLISVSNADFTSFAVEPTSRFSAEEGIEMQIAREPDADILITFEGDESQNYEVQSSFALSSKEWSPHGAGLISTGDGRFQLRIHPDQTEGARFYRVVGAGSSGNK
jgi:hypothetical protein